MAATGSIFATRLCSQAQKVHDQRLLPSDSTRKAMKKVTLTVPAKASKALEPAMALPR